MTGNTEFYFISVLILKQELFGILNINSTFRITVSWHKWGLAGLKADSKPRMKFSQLQDGFCPLPQQPCVTQVLLKALTQTAQQTLASMCTEPALLTLLNAGTLDPSGLALLFLYHSTYQASKCLLTYFGTVCWNPPARTGVPFSKGSSSVVHLGDT